MRIVLAIKQWNKFKNGTQKDVHGKLENSLLRVNSRESTHGHVRGELMNNPIQGP